MSEWPKTANQIWAEIGDGFRYGKTEVITADLGRELYEALKTVLGGKAPADPSVSDALARYEREVGS